MTTEIQAHRSVVRHCGGIDNPGAGSGGVGDQAGLDSGGMTAILQDHIKDAHSVPVEVVLLLEDPWREHELLHGEESDAR